MHDTADTTEIDCPYFDSDWSIDHPDWPPDQRVAEPGAVDENERR